jgi:hypothetical protein
MVAVVNILLYSSLFINLMYSYPRVKNYYKSFRENKIKTNTII